MHNLKPKKRLGQHFLRDQGVARRIVDSLASGADTPVVEIGPGEGVLSLSLAGRYPRLTLLEVDPDAVTVLRQNPALAGADIVQTDVLQWDPASHVEDRAAFIGNLPYNISSPIFFHLLENHTRVAEGVFMIQKEVAERICAGPGSKTYGILSVLLQSYFSVTYLFSVPPHVFRPPPQVMSGVIRLVPLPEPPAVSLAALKTVVKTAFQQRRKTLRNALSGLIFPPFDEQAAWWPRRAEELAVADFQRLAAYWAAGVTQAQGDV
ncbi:MAG: 16S rRNA (adenine(1518)-N(6)/adenine(1519)-N(6)) -dimethyltransferase RsmA [Bacteroidia bacterium]